MPNSSSTMRSNRYEEEEYYQTDRHAFPTSPPRKTGDMTPAVSFPADTPAQPQSKASAYISSNSSTTSNSSGVSDVAGNAVALASSLPSRVTIESDASFAATAAERLAAEERSSPHERSSADNHAGRSSFVAAESKPPSNSNNSNSSNSNTEQETNSALLRKWTPTRDHPSDPDTAWVALATEVDALDQTVEQMKKDLEGLKRHGNKQQRQRQHQMDALEMRQMAMNEVLRRMDAELHGRDVYEYGDILAATFGSRKIFAHRAIGLEALLCQFMHQMLAKQHQLKIMKRAGKDMQALYKQNRNQVRDEYHSYQALTVQMEASRLSLEKFYEDLFSSQHQLLSKLMWLLQHPEDYDRQQLLRNAMNSTPRKSTSATTALQRPSRNQRYSAPTGLSNSISRLSEVTSSGVHANNETADEDYATPTAEDKAILDASLDDAGAVLSILKTPSRDDSVDGLSVTSSSSRGTLASKASEIYAASRMKRRSVPTTKTEPTVMPRTVPSTSTKDKLRALEQQRIAAGKAPLKIPIDESTLTAVPLSHEPTTQPQTNPFEDNFVQQRSRRSSLSSSSSSIIPEPGYAI